MVFCMNGYAKNVESRLIFLPKPDDMLCLLSTYFMTSIIDNLFKKINKINKRVL